MVKNCRLVFSHDRGNQRSCCLIFISLLLFSLAGCSQSSDDDFFKRTRTLQKEEKTTESRQGKEIHTSHSAQIKQEDETGSGTINVELNDGYLKGSIKTDDGRHAKGEGSNY